MMFIVREPITTKETASLQNSQVKVGSSSMQGWRSSMDDAHAHFLELPDDPEAMFFGVYDGHGYYGAKISTYVSKRLHADIAKQADYRQGQFEQAIVKGFLACDEAMHHDDSLKDESTLSGTTAITVLVRDNVLYVGNVGDSRCVCSDNGKAHALSRDHKPDNGAERMRIEAAGGFVEANRVNCELAMSRALGDFSFKKNEKLRAEDQMVSGCPDVVVRRIEDSLDFMVLACDGIWDVLTGEAVVDFVTRRIGAGSEPETICEDLMDSCLAKNRSMVGGQGFDNMTVIIVAFLHGKPYQRLVSKCADFVKQRDAKRVLPNDQSVASSSKSKAKEDNGACAAS